MDESDVGLGRAAGRGIKPVPLTLEGSVLTVAPTTLTSWGLLYSSLPCSPPPATSLPSLKFLIPPLLVSFSIS